jgi:phenylacetate-coenzyme A ligase PaaK-like adenylate-forming protein
MSNENAYESVFSSLVQPWYQSLVNPEQTQKRVLDDLVKEYAKTRYGQDRHAYEVEGVDDFRKHFSTVGYRELNPYFVDVMKGDYASILPQPLLCWVMTRGSTGPAKVLPVTKKHIEQILTCGSRALINHALRSKNNDLFGGRILNLNFPSNVHTVVVDGQTMTYGYSSGTYARLNPALDQIGLIPRQEDIDALGSGIKKIDWEKRFELVYQQASNQNVTAAMGVTPVILFFAKYLERKHGKKPKDLWNIRALFCTSVRKIQYKYGPVLRKYFGQVPIVEIYSATEGVFGQQLDDLPYITPNYDTYFFEVATGKGIKMLHELKRGEWGELVVSSCLFPRYAIGDMIEAAGKNYFRIFGRRNVWTLLEHRLHRLLLGWSI